MLLAHHSPLGSYEICEVGRAKKVSFYAHMMRQGPIYWAGRLDFRVSLLMIMSDQTMLQRWAKKRAILKGAYAISYFFLAAPLVLFHHLNSRWQRWETSLSIQIIKDFTYKDNFIVRRIWKRVSWGRGGGGSNCDQIIQSASQIKKKRKKTKWISIHFG